MAVSEKQKQSFKKYIQKMKYIGVALPIEDIEKLHAMKGEKSWIELFKIRELLNGELEAK